MCHYKIEFTTANCKDLNGDFGLQSSGSSHESKQPTIQMSHKYHDLNPNSPTQIFMVVRSILSPADQMQWHGIQLLLLWSPWHDAKKILCSQIHGAAPLPYPYHTVTAALSAWNSLWIGNQRIPTFLSWTFGSSCLLHDCRPSIEVWRDIADRGEELLSHGAHEGGIELHRLYPKGYLLLQRLELGAWMPEFP